MTDHFLRAAIFGLGSMGYGMARSLLAAGHQVYGFDISDERMAQFVAEGGMPSGRAESISLLDCAVIVVLNEAQTEDVLFGDDGIVAQMKSGAVVISCATITPDAARRNAARCAEAGVHYLDAPISGGSIKAANGALSIMASGTPVAFDAAAPALDALSETVFRLGDEAGAGSAMKSVNQLLAGVHIAVMGEAVAFGLTQGVNPEQLLSVISKCAGTSWMLENRLPHIVEADYSPHSAINIWLKDLGIVADISKETSFIPHLALAALERYRAAADQGLGLEDDAAIVKPYAKEAGITLP